LLKFGLKDRNTQFNPHRPLPTAMYSTPLQASAPGASAVEDSRTASHSFTSSLASSVPEMYRRTLAAMIEGQKASPLIPVPHIACCSHPAVALGTHAEISNTDKLEGTSDEELVQEADVQAEKMDKEIASKEVDERPWNFKPSVATWLMPLHSSEEACKEETALKASESSAAAVQEPPAVTVAKVQSKGLGARIKALFGCAQASAAEPKSMKTPKARKTSKARKASKTAKSKP